MNRIFISTDQTLLDFKWLSAALMAEYWGWHLTEEKIRAFCPTSLCFGVYERTEALGHTDEAGQWLEDIPPSIRQIGFARVITDKVSFSYIGDVVIDKIRRREGLGTRLMEAVVGHPNVKPTVMVLGTKDAWLFYERFLFGPPPAPMMQRDPPQ